MQSDTDAVTRSLGDVLLQLGCHSGWLIPNTMLSTKPLNNAVAQYEARLDDLELQVSQALAAARAQNQPAQPPPTEEIDLSGEPQDDLPIDLTSPKEFDWQNGAGDGLDFGNDFGMYDGFDLLQNQY